MGEDTRKVFLGLDGRPARVAQKMIQDRTIRRMLLSSLARIVVETRVSLGFPSEVVAHHL